MLKIEIEYKKGILFVRLIGEGNKSTIKTMDIVDNMIKRAGIKYLLINLEKVVIINQEEIISLISKYKNLIGKDGKLLICGYYDSFKLKVDMKDIDKIYWSGREVSAFNIINI